MDFTFAPVDSIVNKVAQSGIRFLDPDTFYIPGPRISIDLAQCLWQGMVLREADFRAWVRDLRPEDYRGAFVAVHCSADALVPAWAYMLVAAALSTSASLVVHGTSDDLERLLTQRAIDAQINPADFADAKVVVKGCGHHPIHVSFHTALTQKLAPVVASLMFGEPCSTVPVFKKTKS